MSFYCKQLTSLIIEPALHSIDMYSPAAVKLLKMTAAQESALGKYLHQINGPALGIYQMEPNTYKDIYQNWLIHRPELLKKVLYTCYMNEIPNHDSLIWNLLFSTMMARIHYYRVPHPLPDEKDERGLSKYWKDHYNTHLGKGTSEECLLNYGLYCG